VVGRRDDVNLTEKGPGHWVCLSLPDGRLAIADGENPDHAPVVAAIRRISQGKARSQDRATVTAWMDEREPLPDGHLFVLRGEAA
jgi:hypothetical protein